MTAGQRADGQRVDALPREGEARRLAELESAVVALEQGQGLAAVGITAGIQQVIHQMTEFGCIPVGTAAKFYHIFSYGHANIHFSIH